MNSRSALKNKLVWKTIFKTSLGSGDCSQARLTAQHRKYAKILIKIIVIYISNSSNEL